MSIKIDGLRVLCDGLCGVDRRDYCTHRCSALTRGSITDGAIAVEVPQGWTQENGGLFGPGCSERHSLTKIMSASLPDPENDPPAIKKLRKGQVEVMREVIKEDLQGESDLEEKVATIREMVYSGSDSEPDFSMGPPGHSSRVEVRVYIDAVEVDWPETQDSLYSITIQHRNLELVNPPPFIDQSLIQWINGCLKTMRGDRLSDSARTMN